MNAELACRLTRQRCAGRPLLQLGGRLFRCTPPRVLAAGWTFGFCGFTTGTRDGLMVVDYTTAADPTNPLAKYLPALREAWEGGDTFDGLESFGKDARAAAKDPGT